MLIAVTLVAVWLGYEFNWLHERRAFLNDQSARYGDKGMSWWTQGSAAPGVLGLIGEEAILHLRVVTEGTAKEAMRPLDSFDLYRRAQRLFPEAQVTLELFDENGSHFTVPLPPA